MSRLFKRTQTPRSAAPDSASDRNRGREIEAFLESGAQHDRNLTERLQTTIETSLMKKPFDRGHNDGETLRNRAIELERVLRTLWLSSRSSGGWELCSWAKMFIAFTAARLRWCELELIGPAPIGSEGYEASYFQLQVPAQREYDAQLRFLLSLNPSLPRLWLYADFHAICAQGRSFLHHLETEASEADQNRARADAAIRVAESRINPAPLTRWSKYGCLRIGAKRRAAQLEQ